MALINPGFRPLCAELHLPLGPQSTGRSSRRAVFLDKDGTLIDNVPYNVDPALIRLAPGAVEGLRLLHAGGYRLIVVSNQSGVARGLFAETDLGGVEQRLGELLAELGVPLAGFYYCPHHPDGRVADYAVACGCRKPAPGLILRAARNHGLDPARCWLVGDILHDIEAGRRAGCRTLLLDNGNETEWDLTPVRTPDHIVGDLAAAARLILAPGAARRPACLDRPAPDHACRRAQPSTPGCPTERSDESTLNGAKGSAGRGPMVLPGQPALRSAQEDPHVIRAGTPLPSARGAGSAQAAERLGADR